MTTTVIQGGRVVDRNGSHLADVKTDDDSGKIVEIGSDLGGDQVLDASGCFVSPGLVDLHTHIREPGNERAETLETTTRRAALGGYTAVVAMPDTDPCIDQASVVTEVNALSQNGLCEVIPAAAITKGRDGRELSPMGELAHLGVRIFTDSGRSVQDAAVMRRAMEYSNSISTGDGSRVVLAQHCQLDALVGDGVMHEGGWSARLGLPGQLAEAEELVIMRDIALARLTGARVHICHVTTGGGVALIRAAKADGVLITADVTPHHLVLSDSACVNYDPNTKVGPPLRSDSDLTALRAGLVDGTIDAIATDHGPCTVDSKELPFDQAPFGALGLETALAVLLTDLGTTLESLLPVLSWRPADIAGIGDRHGGPIEVGRPANLTIIDPYSKWTVDANRSAGPSTNTPFHQRELTGRVRHTIYRGDPVVVDGKATR